MGRPPITAKGKLRDRQIEAALDYVESNATGGGGPSTWASITGKPSTFPPDAHTHAQGDVTGLSTALAGKADTTHSHAIADVTGLQTALDGKQAAGSYAAASHTHTASQISDSTAAGRTLLTAADAAAQRTALTVESTTQLDARDTANRNRANHTGTQAAGTITGLAAVATSGSAADLSAGILPAARFDDTAHGARAGGTLHAAASTTVAGFMSAADKTKLDGIATGAQVNVATDLSYTASTRLLASSTGADVTLPLLTSTDAGLAPASGGGTSNFLRADGTWAAPAGGSTNRMGFNVMRPATGVFISNSSDAGALGTQAQVANRTVAAAFVSPYDLTIDQLGISVSTLLAGANCKVVIYNADSNGRPSTVLIESGNISAAAAATVFATITSTSLAAGTKYWIAVRSSGTQTLRTLNVSALPVLSYTNAATPVAQQTLVLTETFANAAATWSYASSQHSNALMPLVLMRLV